MTKEEPKNQKSKKHKTPKKVFDVVRPGKSPAPPNSRSVIVGHKKQVQDDQFVAEPSSSSSVVQRFAGDPSEKRPLLDSHKKIALKPDGFQEDSERRESKSFAGEEVAAKTEPAKTTVSISDDGDIESAGIITKATAPTTVSPVETSETGDAPKGVRTSTPSSGQAESGPLSRSQNEAVASEHLADLAIEQVVETPGFAEPATGVDDRRASTSGSPTGAQSTLERSTSGVDDLLAESTAPDLEPQKAIVSTHRHHTGVGRMILIFFLIILAAIITLNFLLDAGVVKTDVGIPYTDLIK